MIDKNEAAWATGFVKKADSIGIIPEAVPDLMRLAVQLDGCKRAAAPDNTERQKQWGSKVYQFLSRLAAPDPQVVALQRKRDFEDMAYNAAKKVKPPKFKPNVYTSPA